MPYSRFVAYLAASTLHLLKGDWAKARALIERQIEALRTANIADELPARARYSARALAQLGDASEALSRLREGERSSTDQAARGIDRNPDGSTFRWVAPVSLLGRLDEARAPGATARSNSRRVARFVAYALQLLGDIAIHPDRFDAESGEAHYREALALAEPRGMRPLVAHCHLGLGKLYARTGQREQAHEHLATATTMYREMDMRFWLEQAEAEIDALPSPELEGDAPCSREVSLRGASTRSVSRR